MNLSISIRTAALAAVCVFTFATPVSAEDGSIDVSPSYTAATCAKIARAAETGSWSPGKNAGVLVSPARTRTMNVAPESAPEWVREMLNGIRVQTSVAVSMNNGVVEARCYYRSATSAWRPFGVATISGRVDAARPVFAPLLTSAECGSLLSTVASTNSWKPQRLATGAARSNPRSFVGLEDFWNTGSLKRASEQTSPTPVRLEGINTFFAINAIEEDATNVSARCFVFDQTLSTWIYAGSTIGQVALVLPTPA